MLLFLFLYTPLCLCKAGPMDHSGHSAGERLTSTISRSCWRNLRTIYLDNVCCQCGVHHPDHQYLLQTNLHKIQPKRTRCVSGMLSQAPTQVLVSIRRHHQLHCSEIDRVFFRYRALGCCGARVVFCSHHVVSFFLHLLFVQYFN